MGRKRRFGISLPEELAEKLDTLSRKLSVDRSSLVEMALREFIHDHTHYLYEHVCRGIMIVHRHGNNEQFLAIVEKFRDIIRSYSHTHIDGVCFELLIVSGSSSRICQLHRELSLLPRCRTRYIPFSTY
ncbi:MAG: CopG family transcriptional regulator [Thermoprotei archaeon]|nr:MAG: CopG family transcriptional regulator [Thermoprotei archaeon]